MLNWVALDPPKRQMPSPGKRIRMADLQEEAANRRVQTLNSSDEVKEGLRLTSTATICDDRCDWVESG